MESLLNWLIGEAGAAWIIGGLGLAFGIYQWWHHRVRPSFIVVLETNRTTIHKLPELQERLSMAFDGQSIDVLGVVELAIRNTTSKPIENIRFRCEVGEGAKILALQERHAPPGVQVDYAMAEDGSWPVAINYLNPFSHYGEQIELTVFCSSHPKSLRIFGGGKDWQVQHHSLDVLQRMEWRRGFVWNVIALVSAGTALALALLSIARLQPSPTHIPMPRPIIGIFVGLLLFSVVAMVIASRSSIRAIALRLDTRSHR